MVTTPHPEPRPPLTPEQALRDRGAALRELGKRIRDRACELCGRSGGQHSPTKGVACQRCGGEIKLRTFYGKPLTIAEGPATGKARAYCEGTCGFEGFVDPNVAAHLRRGRGMGVAL